VGTALRAFCPTLRLLRRNPARHCPDQPQHATRMLTVGDPIKVNAGFDLSAAASSASSAISKARRSSSPCSGALIPSFILPIRFARRHRRLSARAIISS
jgi:hypothetical protein